MKLSVEEGASKGEKDIAIRVPVIFYPRDDLRLSHLDLSGKKIFSSDCSPGELVKDAADKVGLVMKDLDLGKLNGDGVSFTGGNGEYLVYPGSVYGGWRLLWSAMLVDGVTVEIRRRVGFIACPNGWLDERSRECRYVGLADVKVKGVGPVGCPDNEGKWYLLTPKDTSGNREGA